MSATAEPAFLVGSERSGTTMLRLMLDHHPLIAWFGELEFLVDRLPESEEWPSVAEYSQRIALDRKFVASGLRLDDARDYPSLMRSFMEQIRERFAKPVIGTTVHTHFDRLLRIWPDARFVHLVRDGRDVARSCIAMGWCGNVWTAAHLWATAERLWTLLVARVPPERRLEVRFETLVQQPNRELARICAFLGLSFDARMLEYHHDTNYERPNPDLVEQWTRKLTRPEIELLEARIGDLLVERGYRLSGLPRIEVSAWRRLALQVQDRWYRMRFRLRRYGWVLWSAELLARRLKWRSWHDAVQLRVNEVDTRHLK